MEELICKRIGTLYVVARIKDKVICYCNNCYRNTEMYVSKWNYIIKQNKSISCGCKIKENCNKGQLIELGTMYDDVTVVKKLSNKQYECICQCGKLFKEDEKNLINNMITQCDECKCNELEENISIQKNKVHKELFYIWSSYKYLYEYPTIQFKKKIIDKNIKFFPKFGDDFNLFYQWAIDNDYRKKGLIHLNRKNEDKDFSTDNCIWSEEDKNKFIDLPKSILKGTEEEQPILEKGILTREMNQIAKRENQEEVKRAREELFDYLMIHYSAKYVPKSIQDLLKGLNNGTSKMYEDVTIEYKPLLDMLKYFENDLLQIYKSKLKKGNKMSPNQRMAYDISVVIDKKHEYIEHRQKIECYNYQAPLKDDKFLDLSKYIRYVAPKENINESDKIVDEFIKEFGKLEE